MTLENWANLASVLLAVECFVFLLVAAVASFFAVRLMNRAHQKTQTVSTQARSVTRLVAERTAHYSEKVVEPVVAVNRSVTRVTTTIRQFLRSSGAGTPPEI